MEDAQAGIDAINAAGMYSVGIGSHLKGADWLLESTAALTFEALEAEFARHHGIG